MVEVAHGEPDSDDDSVRRFTVLGLFEDSIDAEGALVALRRADRSPEQVSVLLRDRDAEAGGRRDRHGAVTRAVVANTLAEVGGWLAGLAALIVPERGTFLVAGPLGAALAGISAGSTSHSHAETAANAEGDASSGELLGGLQHTLIDFGFGRDEASYLEHRLTAGAAVVAVTTTEMHHLYPTRQLFAEHDAVHIGQAQTGDTIAHEAEALLAAPPEASSGGDVVVTDAVAPLRRLCRAADPSDWSASLCGGLVLDRDREEAGEIIDLLVDAVEEGSDRELRMEVRYVVIGYGGLLGLGRRHVAVPAAQISLSDHPAALSVTRGVLHHAPAFDPDFPFSRREEQAICAYFGTVPYWLRQ